MPRSFTKLPPKQAREALSDLPGWQVAPGISGIEGTFWLGSDTLAASLAASVLLVGLERGRAPRLQLEGRRLWICWPSRQRGHVTAGEVELARLTATLVPAAAHRAPRSRERG